MNICVVRSPGDIEGVPIFDPLLSSAGAAVERGRQELDDGEGLQEVLVICVFRASVTNGQLIQVIDSLQGEAWRGKVIGVEHRASGARVLTQLRVVR